MSDPRTARLQELIHRRDKVLAVLHPPSAAHARIMEKAGCEALFVGTGGVVGASLEPAAEAGARKIGAGVGLSLVAAAGFGFTLVALSRASAVPAYQSLRSARYRANDFAATILFIRVFWFVVVARTYRSYVSGSRLPSVRSFGSSQSMKRRRCEK